MKSTPANRYKTMLWFRFLDANLPHFDKLLKSIVPPQYPPRWRDGSSAIIDTYGHFKLIETRIKNMDPNLAIEAHNLFDKGPNNIRLWTAFEGRYKRHRDHNQPKLSQCISDCCRAAISLSECLKLYADDESFEARAHMYSANSQLGHWLNLAIRYVETLIQDQALPELITLDDLITCLLEQVAYLAYDASKFDLEYWVNEAENLMVAFPTALSLEESELEVSEYFGAGDKKAWSKFPRSEQRKNRQAWLDSHIRTELENQLDHLNQKYDVT